MEAFQVLGPKEQVKLVCAALKQEDWAPLDWFCELHQPSELDPLLEEDLASALRNVTLLNAVVLEAMNVPRQFATLLRLWSRIGVS